MEAPTKKLKQAQAGVTATAAANDHNQNAIAAVINGLAKPATEIKKISNKEDIRKATTRIIDEHGNKQRDGVCYYVSDGTIKFRHEGSDARTPPVFLLEDRSGKKKYDNKVLVEFSASGSGKTVDLAGAAASLLMDLTIIVSLRDKQDKFSSIDDRNRQSMILLTAKARRVMEDTPNLAIICTHASSQNHVLKVAFSLDESSGCRNLVRSIIHNQQDAKKAVAQGLGVDQDALEVRFMVGGTGAASGTIGSNTKNFQHVQPTGRDHPKLLAEIFLGNDWNLRFPGQPHAELVTSELIKEKLPVLAMLMDNGRMSSIAAELLKEWAQEGAGAIDEARIINTVIQQYIEANRMQDLVHEGPCVKSAVASCAFAVHLFQYRRKDSFAAPEEEEEFQNFLSNMECGVKFCNQVALLVGGKSNPIQTIVSEYGLLEPNLKAPKPGKIVDQMFVMQPAQQLVALTLLGINPDMLLEPSAFGFEVLSTHVAKSVIAAASVIDEEHRPNLQATLAKIGFRLDDKVNTSSAVKDCWEQLGRFTVASHEFKNGRGDDEAHFTRTMKVEMELYEGTDGSDLLQIDRIAHESLSGMTAHKREVSFACPAAWINFGNSPLADGFVTFFCTCNTDDENQDNEVFKFTLMIQAKDYHNDSKLNAKKLEDHALRCNDESLNGVFGSARLLGVAGRRAVLHTRCVTTKKRNFMPYALDDGIVLEELLSTLELQRNVVRKTISTHAVYCKSDGEIVM